MDITETQQAVLALIAERIAEEGMPPSQAEIARAFGFSSVRAAQYHLEALEAAGAIERVPAVRSDSRAGGAGGARRVPLAATPMSWTACSARWRRPADRRRHRSDSWC